VARHPIDGALKHLSDLPRREPRQLPEQLPEKSVMMTPEYSRVVS
jgi:hypothetical protein